MIIDIDSHVREIYFMDEIYKMDGIYSKLTPKKSATVSFSKPVFFIASIPSARRRAPASTTTICSIRRLNGAAESSPNAKSAVTT